MNLKKILSKIINEQSILKTTKTKPIVDAIKNRVPVSFMYIGPRKPKKESVKPGNRIKAEIVALGLSKKGNLIARAYVQPPSVSKKGFDKHGWRTFMVSRMSNVKVHDGETFDNKRPQYNPGEDKSMTVTYVTSDWTTKPKKVTKQEKPTTKQITPTKPEKIEKPAVEPKPTTEPTIKPKSKPEKIEKPAVEPKPTTEPTPAVEPKNELPPIPKKEKPEVPDQDKSEDNELDKNEPNKEENNISEIKKRFKSLIIY